MKMIHIEKVLSNRNMSVPKNHPLVNSIYLFNISMSFGWLVTQGYIYTGGHKTNKLYFDVSELCGQHHTDIRL